MLFGKIYSDEAENRPSLLVSLSLRSRRLVMAITTVHKACSSISQNGGGLWMKVDEGFS